MARKPTSKAVVPHALPRPAEGRDAYQDILTRAERKMSASARLEASYQALRDMADVAAELDDLLPKIEKFAEERVRLADYDASAQAIIDLSQMTMKLVRLTGTLAAALIDREMEGGI